MTWSLPEISALLIALGVGPLILKLVEGIRDSITGKHDRETKRVQGIISARNQAEQDRDLEAPRRRDVEEENHQLRLIIRSYGGGHLLSDPISWDSSGSIIEPPRKEEDK